MNKLTKYSLIKQLIQSMTPPALGLFLFPNKVLST